MAVTTRSPSSLFNASGWTNGGNVYTANNVYATLTTSSNNVLQAMEVRGFDFSTVSSGDTLDGVQVTIEHFESQTTQNSLSVALYDDTTLLGETAITTRTAEGVDTVTITGVTMTNLKSSTLGLRIEGMKTGGGGSRTFSIDHVQIVATHTAPPAPVNVAVGRFALATASTPSARTDHTLKVKARSTQGGGTLTFALFEGTTQRATFTTAALTTTLTEYTGAISGAEAEAITSYAGLEVRLSATKTPGPLTVEVSEASLTLPEAAGATLVVASATAAQTVAPVALVQDHTLVAQGATQAQTVGNTVLVHTWTLAPDGTTQAQTADEPLLVYNVALTVDGAELEETSTEPTLSVLSFLAVQGSAHTQDATEPVLASQSDLVPSGTTQAQTAGAVVVVGNSTLTVDGAGQAQTVDELGVFAQFAELALEYATQAQTAGSVALIQAHALLLADTEHAQSAEPVLLTQDHVLAGADAEQPHTVGEPALEQLHQLTVDPTEQGSTGEQLSLAVAGDLVVAASTFSSTVDGVAMSVEFDADAASTTHDHSAGSVVLVQEEPPATTWPSYGNAFGGEELPFPAYTEHAQSVSAPVLVEVPTLLVAAAGQAQSVSAAGVLSQTHVLTVGSTTHASTVTAPVLVPLVPGDLSVASTTHAQDAGGSFPLSQVHVLAVAGTVHAQAADNAAVTELIGLVVASVTQLQEVADAGSLAQLYLLGVAGAHQPQSAQHVAVVHVFAGNPDVTVTVWGPTCASVRASSPTVTFVVTSPTV